MHGLPFISWRMQNCGAGVLTGWANTWGDGGVAAIAASAGDQMHPSPAAARTACPQECGSLLYRMAPDASVARVLRGLLRYLADATMLQLMSGEKGSSFSSCLGADWRVG